MFTNRRSKGEQALCVGGQAAGRLLCVRSCARVRACVRLVEWKQSVRGYRRSGAEIERCIGLLREPNCQRRMADETPRPKTKKNTKNLAAMPATFWGPSSWRHAAQAPTALLCNISYCNISYHGVLATAGRLAISCSSSTASMYRRIVTSSSAARHTLQ